MYIILYKGALLSTVVDFPDGLSVIYEKFGTGYSIDLHTNVPGILFSFRVTDQLSKLTEIVTAVSTEFVEHSANLIADNADIVKKKDILNS